jgi:hydroxyacylglutathione hydrolase
MKCLIANDNIEVYQSAIYQTNTTIVIGESHIFLFDPNWLPIEIDFLRDRIDEILSDKKLVLIFTHSDYDHIIGYKAFAPDTVIAAENFSTNKEKESLLIQINDFDDEYYISRNYAIEYPKVDITIKKDYTVLEFGSEKLTFLIANGHTADGIITYFVNKEILILGDYLCKVEFPYIYFSSYEYDITLNKIKRFIHDNEIKIGVSGHGDLQSESELTDTLILAKNYIVQLRDAIALGKPISLENFNVNIPFPKIMTDYHNGNIQLIKKELSSN